MSVLAGDICVDRFDGAVLEFATVDEQRFRKPMEQAWPILFDLDCGPVRNFPSFRGQRNFPGSWWFARSGSHVGYESWLERDHLMAFDADPDVVGVASQPFRIHWPDGRHHVPDFFVRKVDGSVAIVDVRADDRIDEDDAELFARSESVCSEAGWAYHRVGEMNPVLAANLRWLSGYRHSRVFRPGLAAELIAQFAEEGPLLIGAMVIGNRVAVLPVLFHLLWHRLLLADLSGSVLDDRTRVVAAPA